MAKISKLLENNNFTNSEGRSRAYKAMKQILKQTTKVCKAESVLNMFKVMCRENLTLKTVEAMCKKLCYPRIERRRDLEKRIMEWKLKDAKSAVAIEKNRLTLEWRRNIEILKEFRINKSMKKIAKSERTIQKCTLKREKKKKIEFLKRRRENEADNRDQYRSNREYLCSTVITHDQEVPVTFDNEARIYGRAEVNEKEMAALRLPPKYTVYEKINKERCQIEIESMVTKYRWEMMKEKENNTVRTDSVNVDLDLAGDENTNNKNETEGIEERAYHYDIDSKTFDFRKMRPTDMPDNKRIYLPDSTKDSEEVDIAFLSHELERETKRYESEQKVTTNLSKHQQIGLKSLREREDIVIFQTDKSSRFSVDTKANYIEACKVHVDKDRTIDDTQYDSMLREMNAHSTMWCKIVKAGEEASSHSVQRVKENLTASEGCDPPPMYALRKDHKKSNNDEEGPPTRPVCGATSAYNGKLSHLISMILKEVRKEDDNACESTEDLLAAIEETNKGTHEEQLIVGSLDVKALYPSLDIPFTAEIVAQEFIDSEVDVLSESVDVQELGLYLVLNMTEDQLEELKIREYCPVRKLTRGRKPNMTGQAALNKTKREKIWSPPINTEPTGEMIKVMLAQAIKIAIKIVMKGHVYKFNGETKQQNEGGAIGLEMTGEIAGVFMQWWDKQMKRKLEGNGFQIKMYKRYVDDINIIVSLEPTRNTDIEVEDKTVMERIKSIGNEIHQSIQLEDDYPSKYSDRKVPILDVKVWIDDSNRVLHEYYSKPVSSKFVVHNDSAMPLRDKRTVLTQDLLRVILRCSPLLPWSSVVGHIENYMLRMQYSGYKEKVRKDVLKSAITAYENIKKEVERGERPLYRHRRWKEKERAKMKRRMKTHWYKKKKKNGQNKETSKEYKSVLFVQPTKNSTLKKRYEETIRKSKCPVKVVERAGTNIKRKLQKSYPFGEERCNSEECFVCVTEGKGNCKTENVTYEIVCGKRDCEYIYIGETSRNAFCRGREHMLGLVKKDENSALFKHVVENHPECVDDNAPHDYVMNVTGKYKTALTRQLAEAVKIEQTNRPLLNSRLGFRTNNTLRLRASLTGV